jgi:hypothetical protein
VDFDFLELRFFRLEDSSESSSPDNPFARFFFKIPEKLDLNAISFILALGPVLERATLTNFELLFLWSLRRDSVGVEWELGGPTAAPTISAANSRVDLALRCSLSKLGELKLASLCGGKNKWSESSI